MATDLYTWASLLKVVDVFKAGNETGWVTPKCLYDPKTLSPGGRSVAPTMQRGGPDYWVDHGTVGTNTLAFWGNGGSLNDSAGWSLAQYLVPRDNTQYRDGKVHDTEHTVFKMCPDKMATNHVGYAISNFSNSNCVGMEYESRQNGVHDITEAQYIKGALVFAHDAVTLGIEDWFRMMHGHIADRPRGRRTDPWAGRFDIAHSWELVQDIRADSRIWQLWNLPVPQR